MPAASVVRCNRLGGIIIIVVVASAVFSSRPAAQQPGTYEAALSRTVHDTALANGLQVVVIENHAVPLVTVEIAVRTGAFTQDSGDQGVPHLYEHMLFKSYGGGSDQSWGGRMGELDATYNGETGQEVVRYFVTLPSASVEGGMRALAELVRDPSFTNDNLVEERRVVDDELARDLSDPVRLIYDQVGQRLWTTVWGRKDPGGDPKTLNAVTVKRLKTIFDRYYVPNNAMLVVSGDITPGRAFKLADERFSHWPRRTDPFVGVTPLVVPPLQLPAALIMQDHVTDALVVMEWQGPSTITSPEDTYAADVLSTILDASGSTFQRRLVDSGLFASCTIGYTTRSHVGEITLTAHASVDSLPHALVVLNAVLEDLDKPVAFSDDELADARQARRVAFARTLEYQTSVASEVAEFWGSADLGYFRSYTDRMLAVTRSDLQRYAQRYIIAKPMALGVLVPPGTGQQVRPVVLSFLSGQ
ncbi:MAG TPA: pitrilysin family protein [Gemmatimonadaceae bacterium]|nr:pitrilysin family protein [Gemmatimonadaceae bacterium]